MPLNTAAVADAHLSELHYPASITAPGSNNIYQTAVNTQNFLRASFSLAPLLKTILTFISSRVSLHFGPGVGGKGGQGLIKGWSRWNMGERYLGVFQPSCREARYKKFRAAAAAATTRELPPPSLCHFRYRLLLQPAFLPPPQPSLSDIITTLSIFSPPPLPGPSIPISSFPFPSPPPSCLFSMPDRA